ncbi:hypothetical protein SCLCIDRAFT_8930 [Scleroderma citrinum Foug A]|uniref:Uncharacterized protein n=1 Tax=Scleroderma citrinum Foug A TaxID=1036808 RepID=A0A0C2ZNQ1_9AGAM|nr:hypothetical protein SCLCIDRAFT_8930 [Scleroderma citrinum Foug A]
MANVVGQTTKVSVDIVEDECQWVPVLNHVEELYNTTVVMIFPPCSIKGRSRDEALHEALPPYFVTKIYFEGVQVTYSSESTSSIIASMDPFKLNQNSNSLYGEDEGPYAISGPDFLFADFTDNTTQDADAFYSYFQNHLSSFTSTHDTFVENVGASQAFSEPSAPFLNVQVIPDVTAFCANLDIHHSTFGPTHNTEFPVENPDIQQLIDALSTSTPDLPSTSSNIAIFQVYIDEAINSISPNKYISYPTIFKSVYVEIPRRSANRQMITALDNDTFLNAIINMLIHDAIIEHKLALLSAHGLDFARHAKQWRGIDEGYSGFHSYEDINSMNIFTRRQQHTPLASALKFETLNSALMEFGSAAFLACLAMTTKPKRALNAQWKKELINYVNNVAQFTAHVLTSLAIPKTQQACENLYILEKWLGIKLAGTVVWILDLTSRIWRRS